MARKTFKDRFPGIQADKARQNQLMALGMMHANRVRDIPALDWLVKNTTIVIPEADKSVLAAGHDLAVKQNKEAMDAMGADALKVFVAPRRSNKEISADLFIGDKRVSPIFRKYREEFYNFHLTYWTEEYKGTLGNPEIAMIALRDNKFRTREDKLTIYGVNEIISNVRYYADELGRNSDDILRRTRDKYYEDNPLPVPTIADKLQEVNARKAYALFMQLERQVAKFKKTESEKDAKAALALKKQFEDEVKIPLAEWQQSYWSLCNWPDKANKR